MVEFTNHSEIVFKDKFTDGTPYRHMLDSYRPVLIDKKKTTIQSTDGNYEIIFEDAQKSGFHRPHWKFHVWLKSNNGFPFFSQKRILYAVIFYDGDGEVEIEFDKQGRLHVKGGYDVKDILYPWAQGRIGPGNPYQEIKGQEYESHYYDD